MGMALGSMVACAALALGSSALAGGGVLVVDDDGGPGVDFTELQPAIDAAAEGDVLLVRDGDYGGFTVQAKSLQIVADTGMPRVGSIAVRDLQPGQAVLLRGFRSAPVLAAAALELTNDLGPVWIEDCDLGQTASPPSIPVALPGPGLRAAGCSGVALVRCQVRGGHAADTAGLPGLTVESSSVWLYDTRVDGADAFHEGAQNGPPGTGVLVESGFLWASGSHLEGGAGHPGGGGFPAASCTEFPAGPGGTGLYLVAGKVRLLDTDVLGGRGGEGAFGIPPGFCPDGPTGPEFVQDGGLFHEFAGEARSFMAGGPVREGESAMLSFRGEPGDAVFLLLALQQSHEFRPELTGVLLLPEPPAISLAGTIGADGATLFAEIPVPDFGPGFCSLTVYAQSIHLEPGGALFLGPGSAVLVLDDGL